MRRVRIVRDPSELAEAAAAEVESALSEAVAARGRAILAVSGGATPRELYRRLGAGTPGSGPWPATHLIWVDERFVPSGAPDSNYRLVRETLLARGRIAPENVHRVETDTGTPEASARLYEAMLRSLLPPTGPAVDVAVLGAGPDGHTASLFPGAPQLEIRDRWVAAVPQSPQPPKVPRVTLTFPLLARVRRVLFLVSGAEKAPVVARILGPAVGSDPLLPAARVDGVGSTEWMLDPAAAAQLERGSSPG